MRLLVLGCLGRLFRLSYEDTSSVSQIQATVLTSKLKQYLAPDCYLYHTENILSSHRLIRAVVCFSCEIFSTGLGEIFSYLDTSVHLLHSQGNMCTHSFQCCWCSERRHHRVWKYLRFRISKNICNNSCYPPVFTLVLVWHWTSLASPAIVTIALGVKTGSVDTTVTRGVETIIWRKIILLSWSHTRN